MEFPREIKSGDMCPVGIPEGALYFDTTEKVLKEYSGGEWKEVKEDAVIPISCTECGCLEFSVGLVGVSPEVQFTCLNCGHVGFVKDLMKPFEQKSEDN